MMTGILPSNRVYIGGVAGGDYHHRHYGCDAAAGGSGGARSGKVSGLPEQSEESGAGGTTLHAGAQLLPAGLADRSGGFAVDCVVRGVSDGRTHGMRRRVRCGRICKRSRC